MRFKLQDILPTPALPISHRDRTSLWFSSHSTLFAREPNAFSRCSVVSGCAGACCPDGIAAEPAEAVAAPIICMRCGVRELVEKDAAEEAEPSPDDSNRTRCSSCLTTSRSCASRAKLCSNRLRAFAKAPVRYLLCHSQPVTRKQQQHHTGRELHHLDVGSTGRQERVLCHTGLDRFLGTTYRSLRTFSSRPIMQNVRHALNTSRLEKPFILANTFFRSLRCCWLAVTRSRHCRKHCAVVTKRPHHV